MPLCMLREQVSKNLESINHLRQLLISMGWTKQIDETSRRHLKEPMKMVEKTSTSKEEEFEAAAIEEATNNRLREFCKDGGLFKFPLEVDKSKRWMQKI